MKTNKTNNHGRENRKGRDNTFEERWWLMIGGRGERKAKAAKRSRRKPKKAASNGN